MFLVFVIAFMIISDLLLYLQGKMSSATLLPQMQFYCSICQQVFTDPVTTPCGHNFCLACIRSTWDSKDVHQCPTCLKNFPTLPEMNVNIAFKELADTFKMMTISVSTLPEAAQGEVLCDVCTAVSLPIGAVKSCLVCLTSYCDAHLDAHRKVATLKMHRLMRPVKDLQHRMCEKHNKLLEMFCRDEETCICQFCADTEHKDHQAVKIEEESENRKVERVFLSDIDSYSEEKIAAMESEYGQLILEREKKVEEIKRNLELSNLSAEQEIQKSDEVFASIAHSVAEKKREVATEIREKQNATERRAVLLTGELQKEMEELLKIKAELEELQITDDHLHLLQRLPSLMSPPPTKDWTEISVNSQLCVGTVKRGLSYLSDLLKHELDCMKKEEMKRMRMYAVDVVMDPDTAHPNIVLTADQKQAGRGELLQIVPDKPQRFDPVICVLGTKGFLSGRFYFQVDVGTKTFWDLGVVKESVNRKGMITSTPENGFWTVRLRNSDEYRALDSPSVLLSLRQKPKIVGVFTDYEKGTVMFVDVDAETHIYTFHECLFSERVFPFFSPGVCDEGKNTDPLIIRDVKP
ncbi:E3 ubiquitin-protein ligase TRIM39-like [Synchiropus picturatus]